MNFEEPKFTGFLDLKLLDEIYETYLYYLEPNLSKKIYIFLDEVQNIYGFEKWANKMSENKNIQIYITGSSSKLLSNELSTILSGRNLQIEMLPLSFLEFLSFNNLFIKSEVDTLRNKLKIRKYFDKYLCESSFPRITQIDDEELKKEEIYNYFLTIILKDVSQRYNISNSNEIKILANYFFINISKSYSVNNLKNLKLGSYDTIKNYIEYFKKYIYFLQ